MTTTQSQKIDEQEKVDIGIKFRQKREALNLSLEDISKEINLRVTILEHIENNTLNSLSLSPTFTKGYVRNYARFLGLSPIIWEPMFSSLDVSSNNKHKQITSVSKIGLQLPTHHRWIGCITVLVILIVIGMTALWWWENYQQFNEERNDLVSNYISNTNSAIVDKDIQSNFPDKLSLSTESNGEDMGTISSINSEDMQSNNTETNSDSTFVSKQDMTENNEHNLVSSNSNNLDDKHLSNLTSGKILENEVNKMQVNEQQNIDKKSSNISLNGELVIEIIGSSCWLSVKDDKQNVLAEKEYKKGEALTFNKGTPYSLIIGAPSNVKITYKGKEYPLTVDGRVARFKLQ